MCFLIGIVFQVSDVADGSLVQISVWFLSTCLFISGGYEVPEQSVMEELFYEYNSEARPASSQHPVVKVSHQLSLTRIISLVRRW